MSYMAPQELKIYILHDLYLVSMLSVFPRSKTGYLIISKNRPISILKKLTEVELQGTSRDENLYLTWSLYSKYGFGDPEV